MTHFDLLTSTDSKNCHILNARWRTVVLLKTDKLHKLPYLGSGLTDLRKILQNDTYFPSLNFIF